LTFIQNQRFDDSNPASILNIVLLYKSQYSRYNTAFHHKRHTFIQPMRLYWKYGKNEWYY